MDQVLVLPEVHAYLADHFIPVRIDFDRDRKIVRQYDVRGIPNIWFLDSRGEKLKNLNGFVPEDVTLSVLKYINEDAFRNVSFSEFLRSTK
jgi:thioredoxin-related protein